MTCVSRRVLVPLAGALALSSILSACSSNGSSGAVGTSGQSASTFIDVDASSPPVIFVENRTSAPLVDVNLAVKSGILVFSGSVSRLEASEKRRLTVADFTSRDGTALNLRLANPKQIAVTAHDLSGKQFEATLPWSK